MATSGYSKTPLAKKLGIKENFQCYFYNRPDYYFDLFDVLPLIKESKRPSPGSLDFVHVFVQSQKELEKIGPKVKDYLKKDGMVWFSWPKGTSGVKTDLSGNIVREYILGIGLVDIKVAAIDETWSGLKFVYRLKDR
jgi:hypothetical protein